MEIELGDKEQVEGGETRNGVREHMKRSQKWSYEERRCSEITAEALQGLTVSGAQKVTSLLLSLR